MVVLNKVKGIYRGSALVKSVTVGTKKIWPSRTITGYRVAAEFKVASILWDRELRVNPAPAELKPYKGVENIRVRRKGKTKSLAATVKVGSLWIDIAVDGNPKDIGIRKGTVCELLEPIYST